MSGNTCLLDQLRVATDLKIRTLGLMFRKQVPKAYGCGLLFPRCRSLHTFHMRFPLDVVFLDADGQPLKIRRSIPGFRLVKGPPGTRHCFEVPVGVLAVDVPLTDWRFEPV